MRLAMITWSMAHRLRGRLCWLLLLLLIVVLFLTDAGWLGLLVNPPAPLQQQRARAAAALPTAAPTTAAAAAIAKQPVSGLSERGAAVSFDRIGEPSETSSTTTLSRVGGRRPVVLLFWTTFWDYLFENLLKEWGLPPNARCSRQCELVYDRRRARDADVVLFHAANTHPQELPTDGPRAAQLWVLFNIEPPTLGYVQPSHDGLFNLSMTYRSDSDVAVGYGHTEALVEAAGNASTPTPLPLPPRLTNAADFAKRKPYAYWIASNCADPRMAYVRELATHIRIDVFGKCGPPDARPCNGSLSAAPDWDCVEELADTYAFYLAFENALCPDYITEKLWRALASTGGAIPVVIGAPPSRYEQLAPPGSYVHAESYASPRDLAAHLTHVASSHDRFMSYHRWRERYRVHIGWYKEFALGVCRLCESTYDNVWQQPPRPAKPDLYGWFSAGCRTQWPGARP